MSKKSSEIEDVKEEETEKIIGMPTKVVFSNGGGCGFGVMSSPEGGAKSKVIGKSW